MELTAKLAMSGIKGKFRLGGKGPGSAILGLVAALAAGVLFGEPASSQSADCARLQQAIANSSRDSGAGQAQAAAERQRAELNRTAGYAHSIGCDNRKFLFFGSDPPPQCGEINAQIGRMQSNLADLQGRAGGGGGRADLIARFNSECAGGSHAPNLLDALFGNGGDRSQNVDVEPLSPDELPQEKQGEARGGAEAVCVKSCDGSFFPVSYAASGGRMPELEDKCRALCPNADVSVYTMPSYGDIAQAISATGQPYSSSPTALKYRQADDSSCSCRRKGESWAEALAPAESKFGRESRTDIVVTAEKSLQMSRPSPDPKSKAAKNVAPAASQVSTQPLPAIEPPPGLDVNGADTKLTAAAATIGHETSGIAGDAALTGLKVGEDQGQTVVSTGPDGVKKRVRIIAPEL